VSLGKLSKIRMLSILPYTVNVKSIMHVFFFIKNRSIRNNGTEILTPVLILMSNKKQMSLY